MDLELRDRVAIVAASSRGLGLAVARGLAREGAQLALCSRNAAVLESAAEAIRRDTGVEVMTQAFDVTVYEEVRRFVAAVLDRYGRLDICVANAGGPPAKTFAETTIEDWHAAAELNLMSTVYFAREVLPAMQQRKWGRFIAITSVAVKQPVENLVLSNSVRSGVVGLVKTLANEYGPDNILVNSVCPGYTATARLLAAKRKPRRERLGGRNRPPPHRPAGGIRRLGRLPGFPASLLHYRDFHRSRRRLGQRLVLRSFSTITTSRQAPCNCPCFS